MSDSNKDAKHSAEDASYYQTGLFPEGMPAPPYGGPPRRTHKRRTLVFTLVGILVVALIIGAGILIDIVLFQGEKKRASEFGLNESESYREAVFDIKNYYLKEYSKEKVVSAAEEAVEKAKAKGIKSSSKLEDIGIKALVKALGDKHSCYFDAIDNKRIDEDLSGSFYGTGIVLREDEKQSRPKVFKVLKGSPAKRAGVKSRDLIMSVDGRSTKGVDLDVVVSWIRGKRGTKVEIAVQREGAKKELKFKITREKITTPDLETEILDGRFGHITVLDFSKGIGEKVRKTVAEMNKKGVSGFILDLRDNKGGLLDEAVKLSSVFLPRGSVVVSYEFKGQKRMASRTTAEQETEKPLVVLVNGMSASASEIVTGALKEHGRATVVGSKTYGKGSIQKIYDLDNGGAIKLTVSLYYLPNGDAIDGKGIEPDVPVGPKEKPLEKAKQVLMGSGLAMTHFCEPVWSAALMKAA
ncbi:MAG: S41 family peptidase [Actinomycetota bacterium]|nr:S41 family peptidase [Actinomycetota bacterium]